MRKKDDETDYKTGYKDKGKGKKKRARNKIRPNFGLYRQNQNVRRFPLKIG